MSIERPWMKGIAALVASVAIGAWAEVAASREPAEEIERLAAWPKVPDPAQVAIDLDRLRKARTEAMAAQGHDGLVAAGAGIVPTLLPALTKEKDPATRERIVLALDAVTEAAHTRLLAKEFAHRSAVVRVWSLQRVARFPDPGVRADAESALARARELAEKSPEDAEASSEVYVAGLCCISAGSLAGLQAVVPRAGADWGKIGSELRTALEAVRGPEATRAVAPLLSEARPRQVVGLHLLAGCGDRASAVPLVRPFLDVEDNDLRVAAINALRGIVDGEPPIEKLAVFDAIEMANRWKGRL